MNPRFLTAWALAAQLATTAAFGGPPERTAEEPQADLKPAPSATLLQALEPTALVDLAAEALERNPGIARARQRAAAAAVRAPQVRALPDPVAALTLFVLPPETRAGPQQLAAKVSQKLPWFGKLALREQAALYAAAAAEAEVETLRLDVLTEIRRLFYELAFLGEHQAILKAERDTLVRFEEAARARYSAGMGLQQEIVRIQAQITRIDTRLLDLAERRASLLAAANALRDRPAASAVEGAALPAPAAADFDREEIRRRARGRRPELQAAEARIARSETLVELAQKNFRPDFTVGLGYTLVGRRDDPAGRAASVADDGDDVLALTGAVNLPVRRRKLEAGLEEALALRSAAEEDRRRVDAEIERSLGDLGARLPLLFEQWELLEKVLRVQAREALRSAEGAYTTGRLNAVDLLDAEVVLFDVRTAAARTLTDWAVARADLERAAALPLPIFPEDPNHDR
jgi:outer membrane protein TolC